MSDGDCNTFRFIRRNEWQEAQFLFAAQPMKLGENTLCTPYFKITLVSLQRQVNQNFL